MGDKHFILQKLALPSTLLLSLVVSWFFFASGQTDTSHRILFFSLAFGSLPLCYDILASFVRRRFGIDVVAITAIASSLLLGEYLVGIVILLMLSTGETLEYFSFRRARKEISSLIEKVPTQARRKEGDVFVDIAAESVLPGDIVLIRPGETVPVDGIVVAGRTIVDESALTGEAFPVEKYPRLRVMSGSINQTGAIEIQATASSKNSKYERIIRLVREAESNEAPFVRMADRYSARFTVITFGFALLAWLLSGDPERVLAVLVVATPCPLILATPIAFASGIGRAAKRGIIVKHGGALESLGNARSFVFDKTGTLTLGTPKVSFIDSHTLPKEDILRIAASLEQFSAHIIARAVTGYAKEHGVNIDTPETFEETVGKGIRGTLGGKTYVFGNLSFLENAGIHVPEDVVLKHETSKNLGVIVAYLADENDILGDIHFSDTVRPEVRNLFQELSNNGIERILMLTGDKKGVARRVAQQAGIHEYRAECLPEDKIRAIEKLKQDASPVIMVGDGVNDAPALVAADTGIALGANGSTASSEAGDIVITVDAIERVSEALRIGKRVLSVAKQGILIGIGMSITLMVFASFGYVPPVLGAVLQEVIDVIAIVNALRVHSGRV